MSSDRPVSRRGLVISTAAGVTAAATAHVLANVPPLDDVLQGDRGSTSTGDSASIGPGNVAPASLSSASGRTVNLASGISRSTKTLTPAVNARIVGEGAGSVIAGDQATTPVLAVTVDGVSLSAFNVRGAAGSDVYDNSAVMVRGARSTLIDAVAVSGVAGSAFYVTGGANHAVLSRLQVSGLSGALPNASDVMLYNTTFQDTIQNCHLRGGRAVGIYSQLNSAEHKILFNFVEHQSAYGILDYDIAPRATYTLILGNTVSDISGAEPIQGRRRAGAGIYTADVGGQIIAHNHVSNTNTSTVDETLAPAALGIAGNAAPAPTLVIGNYAHHNAWYGIMVLNGAQSTPVIGNVLLENKRDQLYFKSSDHAFAIGNSITALTAPASQERCIAVNVVGAARTGALVLGNRTRGGSLAAIDLARTSRSVVASNNIGECAGRGVQVSGAAEQVVTGNLIDVSAGSGIALNLVDVTDAIVTASVLKIAATATIALATSGKCTGTRIDKTVLIAGRSNPMDTIDNAGVGCIVEQWGTAPPTRLTHQPGDTVWNSAITPSAPVGWRCVAAGRPGTWRALPNV